MYIIGAVVRVYEVRLTRVTVVRMRQATWHDYTCNTGTTFWMWLGFLCDVHHDWEICRWRLHFQSYPDGSVFWCFWLLMNCGGLVCLRYNAVDPARVMQPKLQDSCPARPAVVISISKCPRYEVKFGDPWMLSECDGHAQIGMDQTVASTWVSGKAFFVCVSRKDVWSTN